MSLRTAVLLSGTGSNFQAILGQAACGNLEIEVVAALSDRPGAQGLQRARDAGIPAAALPPSEYQDRRSWWEAFAGRLRSFSPQVLALAGFMRILPASLCDEYRGRTLNIHPSLLPGYPGLNTYRRVLEAGEAWHGATLHFVTRDLDSGPLVAQARLRVTARDDEASLKARVQACEHVLYPRVLQWMADGRLEMVGARAALDGRELLKPIVFEEKELL